MNKEFNSVIVDIDRYSELISIEARLESFKRFVSKSEYSISKTDIASILGFELAEAKGDAHESGDI